MWMIVVVMSSAHRVELPAQYATEAECLAAAQGVAVAHPGASAACVATQVAVSEDSARRTASEEWWRSRRAQER
jgi:hypothetical protein